MQQRIYDETQSIVICSAINFLLYWIYYESINVNLHNIPDIQNGLWSIKFKMLINIFCGKLKKYIAIWRMYDFNSLNNIFSSKQNYQVRLYENVIQ